MDRQPVSDVRKVDVKTTDWEDSIDFEFFFYERGKWRGSQAHCGTAAVRSIETPHFVS